MREPRRNDYECRRYWFYADLYGLCVFYDTGAGIFLRRTCPEKNVVNTMMACAAIMGLSVVMWTLFGYSLAFGGNHGGIIGDFRWFAMNGVGWEPGPVCRYHSASGICSVSDDVCHDHTGTDHRCCCWKMRLSTVSFCCNLVCDRVLSYGTHGLGRRRISGSYRLSGFCRRKCSTYQLRCQCTCTGHLS